MLEANNNLGKTCWKPFIIGCLLLFKGYGTTTVQSITLAWWNSIVCTTPRIRGLKEPEFHGSHESFAVVQSPQYTTIATEFNLSTEAINIVVMLCNIAPTDHRSDSWVC
jgi:hypothetical protein